MDALTTDQQCLAANGVSRVEAIAARYARRFPSEADGINSAAMLGVIKAAGTYNEDHVWDYWVKKRIEWEIKNFLKGAYKRHPHRPHTVTLEAIEDEHDCFAQVDDHDAMEAILEPLKPYPRALCQLVYIEDATLESASQALGVSLSTCKKHHRRLLSEIKENIEN